MTFPRCSRCYWWAMLEAIVLGVCSISPIQLRAFANQSPDATTFMVERLVVSGTERTNPKWLEAYLNTQLPQLMTREDAIRVSRKLMTTGVFRDVKVVFEPKPGSYDTFHLHVHVEEKWTIIPVVRAAFGGGTPLRVFGIYDTHVLGRLITLGGEMRQYGTSPPGFVVYARDPRAEGGNSYLGAEVWRDFRARRVYDPKGYEVGDLSINSALGRIRLLRPLGSVHSFETNAWRYGFDAEFVNEGAPKLSVGDSQERSVSLLEDRPMGVIESQGSSPSINIPVRSWTLGRILPTILYDDIELDLMRLSGLRVRGRAGPILGVSEPHGLAEMDLFAYSMVGADTNFAAHMFMGMSTLNTSQSRYYLGGFESVRGLPDGYMQGTRAAYGSLEARQIVYRAHRLWIQTVAFTDLGMAADSGGGPQYGPRSAAGVGVRLSVPQINRMVFRIDYAWSIDGKGQKGLTAGMGQFFDPFPPL